MRIRDWVNAIRGWLKRPWLRYWWLVLTAIAALGFSLAVSAQLSSSTVDDHTGQFLDRWASTWVLSLATLVLAIAALQQVIVIREGQRVQNAPVLRLDLSLWMTALTANPREGRYADPFTDDDLDTRRELHRGPEYLILRVQNLQTHPAGSASDAWIQVVLGLGEIEYPFEFPLGHIAPNATEIHALVDLGGLTWVFAEITYVAFADDSGKMCHKAHGLAVLERRDDGGSEPGYITIG